MSSLTNINNNSSVINVGRTTPVSPGPRPAAESIPVVVASDQSPIPVIEQQKIQSEVALSLLGIPRSEVALGLFSDVNTYDVNPNEWSESPPEYTDGWGVKHLPQEAGAIVQAPKNEIAVLSSKRFFRYQPGRVSSATFGVKSTVSPKPDLSVASSNAIYDLNPAIRKYGIFDKFDGYYWETRGDAKGDNFAVVRRSQSLLNINPIEFSDASTNQDDYRIVGKAAADPSPEPNQEPRAIEIIRDQLFNIVDDAYDAAVAFFETGPNANTISYEHLTQTSGPTGNHVEKCKRDTIFALNAYILDLQYGGRGHTITNATTYRTAFGPTASADPTTNARRTAENKLHEELGEKLKTALSQITDLNGISRNTRIDQLTNIIRKAVGNDNTLGDQPSQQDRFGTENSAGFWPRNRIKTVFSIYKRYLGYLISESFVSANANYTDGIKYKCLRDVGYIADGYSRDLAGGGNAATVYNMKNFYFFNNVLQVTTEFASGYDVRTFHVDAHRLLKLLISKDGAIVSGDLAANNINVNRWDISRLNDVAFVSVLNYFGLGNIRNRFNDELADPLIANFTTPYTGKMDFGTEPQFGDLITLRDGLIHIHAAVYDPSLLKPKNKIRVRVNADNNTLEASEGEFVVGQIINFIGDAGGLTTEKFYAVKEVKGPLSNIITLYDPLIEARDTTREVIDITSDGNDNFIEIHNPFVFPSIYQKGETTKRDSGGNPVPGSAVLSEPWRKYDGMFPYMYGSSSGLLNEDFEEKDDFGNTISASLPTNGDTSNLYVVGFINSAIDTSSSAYEILRKQIDGINLRYNNWIKQNVDPQYYAVYEYRVPRSYFSTDKLDGETRKVIYSDVAIGETLDGITKVRPGQDVLSNGAITTKTSVWGIDLTKVTMLKVDFSWYGAVGALFLAYVPVSNDEARWVRVHHLRASNQLKISSLGNATLPITYITYGGGTEKELGLPLISNADNGYSSPSEHVVKYGASYYIDGGDRGTVRLYSHTNLLPASVFGRTYTANTTITEGSDDIGNYITIPSGLGPSDKTFFMKAQVVTSNVQDQNVQVIWVEDNKLYLNKAIQSTSGIKLISRRPSISFGLKSKINIFNSTGTGVRNRVQVYPTKLSTANFANVPMNLDILKTPIFQTTFESNGNFILDQQYTVTSSNAPLSVASSSLSYLSADGQEIYGWFRANVGTVFGRLYREGGDYYFQLKDVFTEPVIIFKGDVNPQYKFLADGRFSSNGTSITGEFESQSQKERLSSVFISNVIQSPIPDTGNIVTSFFLSPGADQFELLNYFDYNKDYLSYPLTDEVESIYLAASLSGESDASSQISTSITWEEQ
jgi:hypothetical protein